jgi:Secretion system C-terminal sorting domain
MAVLLPTGNFCRQATGVYIAKGTGVFGINLTGAGQVFYAPTAPFSVTGNQYPAAYLAESAATLLLPVHQLQFTAVPKIAGVSLQWQTTGEFNVHHFEIERSASGVIFERLASVAAKGISSGSNYTTEDPQPLSGKNYYRLISIDNDGSRHYSTIKMVSFEKIQAITIYPNPAQRNIVLRHGFTGRVVIGILDAQGSLVYSGSSGSTTAILNVGYLKAGKYNLVVTDGRGKTEIANLVKQ